MSVAAKHLKALTDLLGEGQLSAWAESFVGNIAERTNDGRHTQNLSDAVTQKLQQLYDQHCNGDPYLRHAGDTQPRGF